MSKSLSDWQASKNTISDFEQLAQLLENYDDMTVKQFCDKVSKELDGQNALHTPSNKKKINNKIVEYYLQKLEELEDDLIEFKSLLSSLEIDKAAKSPELTAIANGYIGVKKRFSSKQKAIHAIKSKHTSHLNSARRIKNISGIFYPPPHISFRALIAAASVPSSR